MIFDFKDTREYEYVDAIQRFTKRRPCVAHVITFGCQQNEADSEKIRSVLKLLGYSIIETVEEADLIILNTCAVRELAEKKAFSALGNLKALKAQNRDIIIGIAGCMAAEECVIAKIKKSFPYVNFTVQPNMLHKLPELIYSALNLKKKRYVINEDAGDVVEGMGAERAHSFSAWVSVMYGCNNFCSYCIVPYVRGRERSRDSNEVIKECRELIENGCREITLLGQNVNSYSSDIDFATLLSRIAELPGDFIIRFMTSHPKDVSENLIRVIGKYTDKIAPTFHLPLQSGSDRILKLMNRTYDVKKYLDTVRRLRESRPGIALTSDIIVGFPSETEEDFQMTLSALREVRFDMVYSFIYSKREGTRAANFENQVESAVQSERMGRLLELQTNISYEENLKYKDTVQRVLIFKHEDGLYTGRTLTNKLVHVKSDDNNLVGQFVKIKIDTVSAFHLGGQLERN